MAIKVNFFDDAKVGTAAKRLALCFNLSARMNSGGNPLSNVQEIFQATTGYNEIPAFNSDEKEYLKLKLIDIASARLGKNCYGIGDLDEEANLLMRTAESMKLI